MQNRTFGKSSKAKGLKHLRSEVSGVDREASINQESWQEDWHSRTATTISKVSRPYRFSQYEQYGVQNVDFFGD